MIPALEEHDETITTNRERIIEKSTELYENLCKDAVNITIQAGPERVPPILQCETEHAFKTWKNQKKTNWP